MVFKTPYSFTIRLALLSFDFRWKFVLVFVLVMLHSAVGEETDPGKLFLQVLPQRLGAFMKLALQLTVPVPQPGQDVTLGWDISPPLWNSKHMHTYIYTQIYTSMCTQSKPGTRERKKQKEHGSEAVGPSFFCLSFYTSYSLHNKNSLDHAVVPYKSVLFSLETYADKKRSSFSSEFIKHSNTGHITTTDNPNCSMCKEFAC